MKQFLKDWMLPIGMVTGISLYLLYMVLPFLHPAGPALLATAKIAQPVMLFSMLFLTFCKVDPRDLKFCKWHLALLAIQAGAFCALAFILTRASSPFWAAVIESAMLCLICPTATAAAVVTSKLGGDIAGIITYTILINLVVAIAVPAVIPLVHPAAGVSFISAFGLIIAKVFPLLICPFLLAWLVRAFMPKVHKQILSVPDAAFYLWAVSMTLALTMTTRSFVHSGVSLTILAGIGAASLLSCIFQFWAGKKIGSSAGVVSRITAGQALGQKNTVFAIWMGYTFLSPAVSVAGGFYTIWHNLFNSWQLYRAEHKKITLR